jgi:hypothetical protein
VLLNINFDHVNEAAVQDYNWDINGIMSCTCDP